MLFTITTTHKPATDLGHLLNKHPARCQSAKFAHGTVKVFFPVATAEICTAALVLDINSVDLVRGKSRGSAFRPIEQYVNDRPYVCSSFLSVAISRVFPQALNGKCKNKPELVTQSMNLSARLSVIPSRGGEPLLRRLFEPLGYEVSLGRHVLDERFPQWGDSPYYDIVLTGNKTVSELLNHVYVLAPVLDNQKHYYVDESEIEKLLARGEGWLSRHPERDAITKRYLKYQPSYTRQALERLMETHPCEEESGDLVPNLDKEEFEGAMNLNDERLGSVLAVIKGSGAKSVIDLGCGEGKLLRLLVKEKQLRRIRGVDVSIRSLEIASKRLYLKDLSPKQKERIDLIQGSLMYKDKRFGGFEVAAAVEVIEHLDIPRLRAFERVVFEHAKPRTVIVTTPNREYNQTWETLGKDRLRHQDHRFEWTREEFTTWATDISSNYSYRTRFVGIGPMHHTFGTPTQMCVFTKTE